MTSSLLAIDEDEIFFRRAARKVSGADQSGDEAPAGVLFLQIDRLGYDTVRRAVRDRDIPTLAG